MPHEWLRLTVQDNGRYTNWDSRHSGPAALMYRYAALDLSNPRTSVIKGTMFTELWGGGGSRLQRLVTSYN